MRHSTQTAPRPPLEAPRPGADTADRRDDRRRSRSAPSRGGSTPPDAAAIPQARRYPSLEEFFVFRGLMERLPRTVLPLHRAVFAKVTDWALGRLPEGRRHLAVCVPPRHGKTVIAHDAVCWLTGLFPDAEWIYASYSTHMAVAQTMRIRAVMSTEWYARVFPHAALIPGQGTRKYFETAHGGHVYGVGMDGTITGFGAGKKRPGFGGGIVIDDPLKPLDARSETLRTGVNTWFTETLLSRRNSDETPILLIMQRLHEDDLAGHVLRTMPGAWDLLAVPALDEKTGTMIWPETFSRESAELLREVDPATFYAQYQQSPRRPGGNIIKLEWWKTYNPALDRRGLIFLTADTAYKARSSNDASVIRAWEGTSQALYCLDAAHGRWEFPRLLEEARRFWEIWQARGAREFWVEDKASGTPLAQTLRDNGIPARDWRPGDFDFPDDKVGRMNEAVWSVHGGRVLVPQGPLEVREGNGLFTDAQSKALIEECAAFSPDMTHAHDDHCDTLTMAVSLWRSAGGGR